MGMPLVELLDLYHLLLLDLHELVEVGLYARIVLVDPLELLEGFLSLLLLSKGERILKLLLLQ